MLNVPQTDRLVRRTVFLIKRAPRRIGAKSFLDILEAVYDGLRLDIMLKLNVRQLAIQRRQRTRI